MSLYPDWLLIDSGQGEPEVIEVYVMDATVDSDDLAAEIEDAEIAASVDMDEISVEVEPI